MITLILKSVGIPMALTVALVPVAKWLANKWHVIDKPSARKIHTNPTPLLGGLAVYAAMVIYEASRGAIAGKVMALVAACGVVALVGALDDRFDIHSRYRLCVQASLGLMLGLADFRTHLLPKGIDLIVSMVWITGMVNAMNCFDCADGVCGGVSGVILLCYGVMLTMAGHASLALISFASAGAVCGFLIFNFPPANIFMGDCGSNALGLLIGAVSLRAMADSSLQYVVYAAAPVALPVADIILVHIRRYVNGTRNIRDLLASTGKDHLPHRLKAIGFTDRQTVLCLCLGTAMLATVPVAVRLTPTTAYMTITFAVLAVLHVEWQYYIKTKRIGVDAVVVSRDDSSALSVVIPSPQTTDV